MIQEKDEYIHEYKRGKDWIESFTINFIDKKNKFFGFADIDYRFSKNIIEFTWLLLINGNKFEYNNQIKFDENGRKKKIADGNNYVYEILTPFDNFELSLNNDYIKSKFNISGIFPIYFFTPQRANSPSDQKLLKEIQLWEQYEQRCKITGTATIIDGKDKGLEKKINCFGQREHSWGKRYIDKITCLSRISIQFRDMAMLLTYIELDGAQFSRGFVSRKSGNIPIQNIDFESISLNQNKQSSTSTEFSYKDAQDDLDLIVSKTIHSLQMPLPKNYKNKFIKLINYSDFTIIGTNKKGIGMEDHFISLEKLKSMD
ncbi:MAG: hypothetical protein SVZ03_16260 [Spirochaetota bacterium]|nr:hypothetical protein [Spirochaetota bacterium]